MIQYINYNTQYNTDKLKMLETTECVQINNNERIYTDCMEFSLLRFLQLIMYDSSQITDISKSKYNLDIYNINEIDTLLITNFIEFKSFINTYPDIYKKAQYYLSDKIGLEQREEWSKLVSDREFFDYYRNDGAKLFTSISNIINFFNGFFSLNLKNEESLSGFNLDIIASKFSTPNKKISIVKSEPVISIRMMNLKNILLYLSRPELDYAKYLDKNMEYKVVFKTTYLDLVVDGYNYQWKLYEVYLDDTNSVDFNLINKFITGHSVIYNM